MGFLHTAFVDVVLTTPVVGADILFALGLVFIFRASRIINLAHGAMAMVPAYVYLGVAGLAGAYGALVVALGVGAGLGLAMDRTVVRRLRGGSGLAQTVGTVGVLGLLLALAVEIWGTAPKQAPSLFSDAALHVGYSKLTASQIALLVVALGLAALFLALFKFTDLGLAMRCAAENRTAARLMGIDPDRTSAVAWLFAGLLAALGGVLLAGTIVMTPYVIALSVLPAFVAALIGGLDNVAGTVWGSVVVGLISGLVPSIGSLGQVSGAPQVGVGVLALAVMAYRGRRFSLADAGGGA